MGRVDGAPRDRQERFVQLYVELHPAITAYVVRRVPESADVGDVVAEVFTVVWRRIDDLPPAPEDRLWVFGVARRCVSQARRSSTRRGRLGARALTESAHAGDPDRAVIVRDAIAALPDRESEALRLVAWDGFSHAEAGRLMGCSANAIAIRVHRARKRLEQLLADEPDPRPHFTRLADGGSQ